MRIVILGATGFLGKRFAAALAGAGHEVTAVSRRPAAHGLAPGIRHLQASIDDGAALGPVLERADWVVHLAWDTTPGTSSGQPSLEVTANLLPTARLLEQLSDFPHCRLLFVSTGGAVYRAAPAPVPEDWPCEPRSCYASAKLAAEMMLRAYCAQTGATVVVLRPSNAYGPGQMPKRQFGIVPTLMRCARDAETFQIWGDGSTVRDYVFVADLEELVAAVVLHAWAAGSFEVFNAGSGIGVSINGLLHAVEQATGRSLRRTVAPPRTVDTPTVILDSSLARVRLGWSAKTPLAEGLNQAWARFTSDD
jgi:UDP-glucose 4-epimerase